MNVTIQRRPTEAQISSHIASDEITKVLDEIRAVLNYISLLETFLRTDYETALFVEDDVDFDVHIMSQMQNISDTILLSQFPNNLEDQSSFQDVQRVQY